MAENLHIKIVKLNNENYDTWQYKVQLLLMKENLWQIVNDEPPADITPVWRLSDNKAKATIGLLVEDNQLSHIRSAATAKIAWENLKEYHQKPSLTNKVFLLKRICSKKLCENGDMENHLNCMQEMTDKLEALGEKLQDHMFVAMLLCSLPESHNGLIIALESRSENELTTVFVKGKLMDEYFRRRNNQQQDTEDKALKIQKTPASKEQNNLSCFFCKKTGHMKKDCSKYKIWKAKKGKVNQVSEDSNNDVGEICFKIVKNVQKSDKDWYIDSGETSHMTNNKDFLTIFESKEENIKTANGELTKVYGFGSGTITCITDKGQRQRITITDAMYVPDLDSNLLSVSKLTQKGFEVSFNEKSCKITKNNSIIAVADLSYNLYKLRTSESALLTSQQHNVQCQHAWHRKLGHRDINAIKDLEVKQLASGIKIKDCGLRSVCECCIRGKMSRIPFPQESNSKTKSILELVHTDVCGPMQTATPSNNRYILTIINDYSRYSKVHLLKQKSDVCLKLKQFVTQMETEYNKKPKTIRSDRGGEYTSKELIKFLKDKGIKTQYTAAYSPQQNGVAERRNRYLMEMTRCMLIDAELSNKYWGEAILTANYLQNRLPTKATGETPYERWYSKKPDLKDIHIFGSKAYVQVPNQQRQKLDDKAMELIFIGYSMETKGYRLLDKETDKIKISRDVKFLDDYLLNEEKENEKKEISISTSSESVELTGSTTYDSEKEIDDQEEVKLRRSERRNKGLPPDRFQFAGKMSEYNISEPETFEEALSGPDKIKWEQAMDEEIRSLEENHTWEIVDLPKGSKVVGCKWVYKIKTDENGIISRYKARLVARGYTQKYGIDYKEVFAPVVRQTTFRTLLAVAGKRKLAVKHYDIKNAFLNGNLEEDIYMQVPQGYEGCEDKVCKLRKGLYGLKQAAKGWNQRLNDVLTGLDFIQSKIDTCLYTHKSAEQVTYLIVYVDDILIASNNSVFVSHVELVLNAEFKVTDLGEVSYYLGMKVERDDAGFFSINQSAYIKRLLHSFNLQDCKVSKLPLDSGYEKFKNEGRCLENNVFYQRLIGALMYISVCTRPDITASIAILSRKIKEPLQTDWIEAKRTLRYLKGTINYKLKLGNLNEQNDELLGYADADWAQDITDRKSHSGYVFKLHGGTISWACRKQACVSLSSTEAEYVALAEASQEAVWLKNLLEDFGYIHDRAILMYEDNQSCLKLISKHKYSKRTKHMDVKLHYIRDLKEKSVLRYEYCDTEHMVADMFTKPLKAVRLMFLLKQIGLIDGDRC